MVNLVIMMLNGTIFVLPPLSVMPHSPIEPISPHASSVWASFT